MDIPILYQNRELSFEPSTLEKVKFLNLKRNGKPNRYSDIINASLEDFFTKEFPKLKIEYYIDVEAEESKKRYEKMMEEQAEEAENRRVLDLAKLLMVEDYINKVKRIEKETGKKMETPSDIRRRLFNYGLK